MPLKLQLVVPVVVNPPVPLMLPVIENPPVVPKSKVVMPVRVTGPPKVLLKLLPPLTVAPFKVMGLVRAVRSTIKFALLFRVTGPVPKNGVTEPSPVAVLTDPALMIVPPL